MTATPTHVISARPSWARDAVFYQIFPDRFARSGRVPKSTNLLSWTAAPTQQGYHGGDLWGVVEHLDHLVDLGINAIYLTPIFQSACNHRYHTHDYYQVDPMLGGNAALRGLIEAAHARHMRIMLDGVFNHASRGFFRFHDILENGPSSAWLDWFHIHGWPLVPYDGDRPANYTGWFNNRALPKFNTDNPAVREYLMQVGEYWIREYDIDGWRLDVPAEIKTPGFWEEFRSRTRALKPDLYLVGELWREAAEWLHGDRFDATMNYLFAAAAISFAGGDRVSEALVSNRSYQPFPGTDAPAYAERIERLQSAYAWETTSVQFNLLASHDAPRVASVARGDKATLQLATLLQMTYPGTPCVYYGDEIALRGAKRYDRPHRDMDARWPFPWHDESVWDREMLGYFRAAIALRHRYPALRGGEFRQLSAHAQQYACMRRDDSDTLLVVLNMSDTAAQVTVPVSPYVRDGQQVVAVFGPHTQATVAHGQVLLSMPARTGSVLRAT
jgi:cyclomaltodextrinase / maltogenic alpha-amylase / neopullulanase